jgi:hypothetical protein
MNLEGLTEKCVTGRWQTVFFENSDGEIVGKVCSECKDAKMLEEYHKDKEKLGGRRAKCKQCIAKQRGTWHVDEELIFEGIKAIKKRGVKGITYVESETMGVVAKECVVCSEIKKLEKFSKAATGLGKTISRCKDCDTKLALERYYSNHERALEEGRRYHRENREVRLLKQKEWREVNREYNKERKNKYRSQERAYARQRYFNNRDVELKRNKEWRKENPDKAAVIHHRRRARKAALPDDLTAEQYQNTSQFFGNACALTGQKENLEKEHAIPLSIGHGGTTLGNCYPMANGINQSKGNKNIFEWFEANRQRFNLEQERFDILINWLASANAMTVEEYREYVYWCHANPNEINGEKETAKADGNLLAI